MSYIDMIPEDLTEFRAWATKVNIQSDTEAWAKLKRADWMLCLAEERGIELDTSKLRHFAADFAEGVLPFFERKRPNDDRPLKAIQAARDYADRKISILDLSAAGIAAVESSWTVVGPARVAAEASAWAAAGEDTMMTAIAMSNDVSNGISQVFGSMAHWANRLRKYFPNPFQEKP
jgi:hypothetical protein